MPLYFYFNYVVKCLVDVYNLQNIITNTILKINKNLKLFTQNKIE